MDATPAALLALLSSQGYLILFLLLLAEGPLVNYVAAFAASLGMFSVVPVFLLAVLGNFLADMAFYVVGRVGKQTAVHRYVAGFVSPHRRERIERFMHRHPGKTLAVIKLTPPLPIPGIVLAGAVGVPVLRFALFALLISAVYSLGFTLLGFYSGVAFSTIPQYFKYHPLVMIVLLVLAAGVWFGARALMQRYSRKIENV